MERKSAPRQAWEGAPEARLEIGPEFFEALEGMEAGQEIWVITWLHQSRRSVLQVHPRGDLRTPLTGVFATRSPDRPNPIGLHRARILSIGDDHSLRVEAIEAIDGTPVLDIKPVLEPGRQC
jgi:tRNA-Thr(GGU) m(6)t(6)A37 methyltransferase TsaA